MGLEEVVDAHKSGKTQKQYDDEADRLVEWLAERLKTANGKIRLQVEDVEAAGFDNPLNIVRRQRFKEKVEELGLRCGTFGGNELQPERVRDVVEKDENYFWFPPETEMVEKGIDLGMNVLLVGPTGLGKTELLERILKRRGDKFGQINMDGETSKDDFIGTRELKAGETVMKYGILPQMMKMGRRLVIDEVDAMTPDIAFTIQRVLEGKSLMMTKEGFEEIVPEKGFLVLGTANTFGKGDDSAMYAGTNILNESFLDRWNLVIRMEYLPQKNEVEILKKRTGISEEEAEKMVCVANMARQAMKEEKLYCTFSTRKLLNWATLVMNDVSMLNAFEVTVLSKVVNADAKVLAEMFQRQTGVTVETAGESAEPDEDAF